MGLRGHTRFKEFSLFFVTTTCHEFLPLIESKEMKNMLMENLKFYDKKYGAEIVSYALIPEYIHLMIFFRNKNLLIDYMRDFKRFTSKKIIEYWQKKSPEITDKITHCSGGQKHKVWMDRFDDLRLYSSKVCSAKLRYINNNPVERGLCESAEDYVYSSAAFYSTGKVDTKISLTHLQDLL